MLPPLGSSKALVPKTLEMNRVTFAEGLLLSTTAVAPATTEQEPHLTEKHAKTTEMLALVITWPISKAL